MIEIKIDEKAIMTDVLNYDGSLHNSIKREIIERLTTKIVEDLESIYFDDSFYRRNKEELRQSIIDELGKEQRNIFRRIMKSFNDKYRWSRNENKLKKMREAIEDISNEKEETLVALED